MYEDSVLFFEFALPQTWMSFRGDSHIYFDSYYKEQINAELFLDGRVCFAENITTDSTDMTGSWEVKLPKTRFPSPSLAATLLTIRGNLVCSYISKIEKLFDSLFHYFRIELER